MSNTNTNTTKTNTTKTNTTKTNTNTTKTLTAQAIATSISTHSTNHGDFTRMIRTLSAQTTGRTKIANAALILLNEQRELLAVAKQFKSFEHYKTALLDRIEAGAKGAKNELKNSAGIKCGQKDVQNFYSLINTALKGVTKTDQKTGAILGRTGCASNHASDGFKLSFDIDNDCFNVEKYVKKSPVKSAKSMKELETENAKLNAKIEVLTGDNTNTEQNSDNSKAQVKNNATVFDLSSTLDQLQNLSIEDVQTLASVLVNSDDDKLNTLCSAIENALNTKIDRNNKKQVHDLDLGNFEIAAGKASAELMTAKNDKSVKSSTVVQLSKVARRANEALVDCQNSMTLEARQY